MTEVTQPYVHGYEPHPVWGRDYKRAWLDVGPDGKPVPGDPAPPRLDAGRRVVRRHRDVRDDVADPGRSRARAARPARDARRDRTRARALLPRPRLRRPVRLLRRAPRARRPRRELSQQARRSTSIIADAALADRAARARRDRAAAPRSACRSASSPRVRAGTAGPIAPRTFVGLARPERADVLRRHAAALCVRVPVRLVPDRRLRPAARPLTSCCPPRRSPRSASRTTRASCAPS